MDRAIMADLTASFSLLNWSILKEDGWYVVAGKIDRPSYVLLVFFVLCIAGLWIAQRLI